MALVSSCFDSCTSQSKHLLMHCCLLHVVSQLSQLLIGNSVLWLASWPNHRREVVQPCVDGDRLSQGRMAKFDPTQIRNPSTDWYKIWNRWLPPRDDPLCKMSCKFVHWGLLGKWLKYNDNFSSICIPFFIDWPTGQTAWRIFTRDGSDNAASCKG